jgi:mannose-6-phosphate isomerase-like protein (cupin superfamily)
MAYVGEVEAQPDGPRVWSRAPLTAQHPQWPRMRSRWLIAPSPEGWHDVALSEWELDRAGWADLHPHTETNLVVSWEQHVDCQGRTVVVGAGELVQVPAGCVGRYWAPEHARMIAVYGPNPAAENTDVIEYWEL